MELEKIRNLSDQELAQQEKTSAEQLFRLRFQAKLGQTEGIKKQRGLKLDVARIKTIARQRALGVVSQPKAAAPAASVKKTRKSAKKEKV